MDVCYFADKAEFLCQLVSDELVTSGSRRITSIISSSKKRGDTIHEELQETLDADTNVTIQCHKNCVSTYTSQAHIDRYLKRHSELAAATTVVVPEKRRRCDTSKFNFLQHCIFCGLDCIIEKDSKHPDRWRLAKLCRTVLRGSANKTFKEVILDVCDERDDELSIDVRVRVLGAMSDLHAADARYHNDCRKTFMAKRSITSASKTKSGTSENDEKLQCVTFEMAKDKSRIWNSVDIYSLYCEHGGILQRKAVMKYVITHFGDEIVVLSGIGVANIVVFKKTASSRLRLIDDDDDDSDLVRRVGKKICQESKMYTPTKDHYNVELKADSLMHDISPTLKQLLNNISERLSGTLPTIMIGNMITSAVTRRTTMLQMALSVLLRKKRLIEKFYDFGICCSYDEFRRFRASAAVASSKVNPSRSLLDRGGSLVQTIADNFDCYISSPNGLTSTHSIALLVTQQHNADTQDSNNSTLWQFPRIGKHQLNNLALPDVIVHRYNGPTKPSMPQDESVARIISQEVIDMECRSLERAHELDFKFLRTVLVDDACPEFNGYNVQQCRDEGNKALPATIALYTPLIDMRPSDPDTMMTVMLEAKRLTTEAGQENVVFTTDQALYRVAVDIKWCYGEQFSSFILRLGGMHTLMSFVGCVGTLMMNTGLDDIMKSAFGSVDAMLTGKKFPNNVRALRLVTEEVLRNVILQDDVTTMLELYDVLHTKSVASKTSAVWIDFLIKPTMIMMKFVRAEREGDFCLHMWAIREMIPYFFAANHFNYARYCLYYLRSMEKLPTHILDKFLKGEHVMRHKSGIWNAIWSDMFIETTFMRHGKGHAGIVGITQNARMLKTWALSLHLCCKLVQDVHDMCENESESAASHKEESASRKKYDCTDRQKIRDRLAMCIDPLNCEQHPPNVVNIVSGRVASSEVNVHEALAIGLEQMKAFEASWPDGFHKPLKKKVTTMAIMKKHVKVGSKAVFDSSLIYSRVMGLMSSRTVDVKDMFKYELAPVPTSLFNDDGTMRSTAKSKLKSLLAVEQSERIEGNPDAIVIDGCAVLWVISWPTSGTVLDYLNKFANYVCVKLQEADVYLVFDRYYAYSAKSMTRTKRLHTEVTRKYQLQLQTILPPQHIVLNMRDNKTQLLDLLYTHLLQLGKSLPKSHKLVVTGQQAVPTQITHECYWPRPDLRTEHEEADVIIVQQAMLLANDASCHHVKVLCDDTDVFVMLLHYYAKLSVSSKITMESTSSKRTVIDIAATVTKHSNIVPFILAGHALSGCDTVSSLNGIGKTKVVKKLQQGYVLSQLGNQNAEMSDIVHECVQLIGSCYSNVACDTLPDLRFQIWSMKMAKPKLSSVPFLKSLPPTTEAFVEHVRRAHLQCAIWKGSMEQQPPAMDPLQFGWIRDTQSQTLLPVALPESVSVAPQAVLEMIRCGCTAEPKCSTLKCGCTVAGLSCTMFCGCGGNEQCTNKFTVSVNDANTSSDSSSDTDDES